MRILICTYSFFPVISPRGLSMFELAKALCRDGHDVTIFCGDNGYNYREIEQRSGMKVVALPPGVWLHRGNVYAGYLARKGSDPFESETPLHLSLRRKLLRWLFAFPVIRFFFDGLYPQGTISEFFWPLMARLRRETQQFDLILSVALPIAVHAAVAVASHLNPRLSAVRLAEYGDPFSSKFSEGLGRYTNALLERLILKSFHGVIVPVEKARSAYFHVFDSERIHVIPQCVNVDDFPVDSFNADPDCVRFAYAGRFFHEVRDPTPLLKHLAQVKQKFCFSIYTNPHEPVIKELVEPWKAQLGNRLIIYPFLPRHACIRQLSQQNFLIHMDNLLANQVPSKGIDYALAGRPVFRFRGDNFDGDKFDRWLAGDMIDMTGNTDLSVHDARRIARQYIELTEQVRGRIEAPKGLV